MQKDERKRHQCCVRGCDSAATHEPHIKLWYRNLQGEPTPLSMRGSGICENHRGMYTTLLHSNTNKSMIAEQLHKMQLPPPDFDSLTIEFREIPRERTVIELHPVVPAPAIIRCGREQPGEGRCTNPAQWQVVIVARPFGVHKSSSQSTRLLMNLHLCNKCKKITKPEDFSGDPDVQAQIASQLTMLNHPIINWKTLDLDFVKITNKEPSVVLREFMSS